MADDVAPAEQDQPTEPQAPETDQPTGEEESFTDSYDPSELPEEARGAYEEAYKRLQGAYTKKTQSLAEERREAEQARQLQAALLNPQVAPAVLAQLGYDERKVLEMYGYQPDEEEPEFDEFDSDARIERLEQTLAQRDAAEQAARQEEAVTDYISEQIEGLEQKAGREFDAKEHQLLDAYARAYAQNGVPNVEGAYELLTGVLSEQQKQWIESKKTPRPPGGGKPGSRTVDLSKETKEERLQRMAEAADAAIASSQ